MPWCRPAQSLQGPPIVRRYHSNHSRGRFLSSQYWTADIHTTQMMSHLKLHTRRLEHGPASGTPACRAAFASYHSRWQSSLTAEHVAVTTGGSEALLFAFTAICDPGDEILAPTPFYTNYNGFATVAGATIKPIPTSIESNFSLPSDEELDALKTDSTRAFVFSNPSNPTGAIYSAEVDRIARWCHRNGLFLISDEVYRRIGLILLQHPLWRLKMYPMPLIIGPLSAMVCLWITIGH